MAKLKNCVKEGIIKDNWFFIMFYKIRAAGYRFCEVFFLTEDDIDRIKGLTAFNYRIIHFLQRIFKEASKMSRVNEGYTITDVVKVGDFEIVIGEHPTAPDKFVCWYCKDGSDYFWGAYSSNKADALRKLCERVSYEATKLDKASAQRPVEHRPVRGDAR